MSDQIVIEKGEEQEEQLIVEQEEKSQEDLERELAEKHGFNLEDGQESSDVDKSDNAEDDKDDIDGTKKEEVKAEPTFEEMEETLTNKPDEFHSKYDSNTKALYFKQKKYKQRAQDAEAEKELLQLKLKSMEEKINELSKPKKEVSADDELLGETDDSEKPLTKADLECLEKEKEEIYKRHQEELNKRAEKIKSHIDLQLHEARAKYQDFDKVIELSNEVMNKGLLPKDYPLSSDELKEKYKQKVIDMDEDAAEFAYRIGKLHPNYGKIDNVVTNNTKQKTDAEKILENVEKPVGSASIGGGAGGSKPKTVEDMTLEDAAKLSPEQWRKLPQAVRRRLLSS